MSPRDVAAVLAERFGPAPDVALVLGSGLGGVADALSDPRSVSFDELPGFPPAGVAGHAGRFLVGELGGRRVVIQSGRYHVYEGHPLSVIAAPVRALAAWGVEILVLTNAAGGVDRSLEPGDLVVLDDHLNLMFRTPLAGPVIPGEERFPDMSAPYDPSLRTLALETGLDLRIPLARGVYAAVTGPSYETPAEVRMIERLGGHVVGMSTVPEALVAAARGLRVLGFSMVTNKAAGLSLEPLSHHEVVEVGAEAGRTLARLLEALVPRLPSGAGPHSTGAK